MKINKIRLKLVFISMLPLALIIKEYLLRNPLATENLYSRLIYPPIGKGLSILTGIFNFSIAELLFYIALCAIFYFILRFIFRVFKSPNKLQEVVKSAVNALCIFSIAYCLFLLLWGFNYYRQPLAYSLGYNIEESSTADLKELCTVLIDKTNQLRLKTNENQIGVMYIEGGFGSVIQRSSIGYENISQYYPDFGGAYGQPKAVIASRALCYYGIGGIYFPFTAEANFNKLVPDAMLPSTLCHEMAHQRGYAREDEANFIAYLTCKVHPDLDFQYSGYLLALTYSMNSLYKYDIEAYNELVTSYSPGVIKDLKYHSEFWKQYEGPVNDIQEKLNDAYLKSNKQTDGIYSYGRMVDLLLAEYQK